MKKQNHKRLAEGEATGHSHQAVAEDAEIWADENGNRELRAPSGTGVKHEEHDRVYLPVDDYNISIQREIDPFEQKIKEVID